MNDSEKAREKFVLKEIDQSFGDCCFWARQGWNAAVEWCKTKSPKRPTAGVGAESATELKIIREIMQSWTKRERPFHTPDRVCHRIQEILAARAESPSTAAEEKA